MAELLEGVQRRVFRSLMRWGATPQGRAVEESLLGT